MEYAYKQWYLCVSAVNSMPVSMSSPVSHPNIVSGEEKYCEIVSSDISTNINSS